MPDNWTPTTPPRTWTPGLFMASADLNTVRDEEHYLKGNLPLEGTFIRLDADAVTNDSALTVDPLPADVPTGTVLYFRSGPYNWARVVADALQGDTTLFTEPLVQDLDDGDEAPFPVQESTEIECPIKITPGLGAGREQDRLHHLHRTNLGSAFWSHVGRKVAALVDADGVDLIFGLTRTGGTEELLGRMRFFRNGNAGSGTIYISTNPGSGFPATPAISVLHYGRIGINQVGANFTLDIAGDLDLTGELIGIALWREDPAGSGILHFAGFVEVTNQLISTVAIGTAPFTAAAGAPTVRNLNADILDGHTSWLNSPVEDNGTQTVATKNTDYTLASVTTPVAGLYLIEGRATADVVSADLGAIFTLQGKVGTSAISGSRAGQIRLLSARKTQLFFLAVGSIAASATVNLIARKNAGPTSTTSVFGSLKATLVGYP